MNKLYLVQADHWSVPGRRLRIAATEPAANRIASDLVAELWADYAKDGGGAFDVSDWRKALLALASAIAADQELSHLGAPLSDEMLQIEMDNGAGMPNVWIVPVDAELPDADRFLKARDEIALMVANAEAGGKRNPDDDEWSTMADCYRDALKTVDKALEPPKPHANPIALVCPRCGSDNIASDAAAHFDTRTQRWELASVHDSETCNACDYEGDAMALRVPVDQVPPRPADGEVREIGLMGERVWSDDCDAWLEKR